MLRVLVLALILSMVVLGCTSSPPTTPTPTPPTPSSTVSILVGAASLGTRAYNPSPLTISAGTTVSWTNNDLLPHTSTANGGTWDSGNLAPGATFRFTFQTRGTFPYRCTFHPGMIGSVIVQ